MQLGLADFLENVEKFGELKEFAKEPGPDFKKGNLF